MTHPEPGAHKIATFIAETEYRDIPKKAILAAKHAILDWTGVAILGAEAPAVKIVAEYALGLGARGEASVICRETMTSAELAALVNGTAGHALDFDDTFANAVRYNMHSTACILPAVLALIEARGLKGRELLTAYVVGTEITYRIGAAIGQPLAAANWHPTPVLGTIGAAAAGAKALRLDAGAAAWATGISASLAGGLMKNFGTMTKMMHAGNGARNGVIAASLAQRGLTADELVAEGDYNFCEAFSQGRVKGLMGADEDLGREWFILSKGFGFKPYPSCRATHAGIDAALQLRKRYGFRPDEVESVTCRINPLVSRVAGFRRPLSGYEAKFSIDYCIARALVDGEIRLDHFKDEKVKEEACEDLLGKINLEHPDGWGRGAVDLLTEIVITLKNGPSYSERVAAPRGEPENPMSEEELVNKFRQCSERVLGEKQAEELVDAILHLEKIEDMSGFFEILRNRRV
jgi:2-methylcitrate dehydratase PrpD